MRTLTFILAASVAGAAHGTDLQFRPATSNESSSLSGASVIATTLSQTNFKTAATVTVKRKTGTAYSDTSRGNQVLSKVYKVALEAGPTPSAQAVPPAVDPGDFLYYEDNLNSAQGWATMTETGAPFVMVYADGKSQGQAAASWSTKYSVAGSGSRDVYVRFPVPSVKLAGRWEDAAKSLTVGRMRIDLLVNGYPAWSTEAVRYNEQASPNGDIVRIETFGQDIGFEGNSHGSNMQMLTTPAKTVTVRLGTYAAPKTFDVTLLYQADGRGASECAPSGGEMDCGGISVKIDFDPSAAQPTFFSKPTP